MDKLTYRAESHKKGFYPTYPQSMLEGENRNRLLDEISKLDVIAGGIKEALDVMEK